VTAAAGIVLAFVLVANGLAAGVLTGTVLGGVPLLMSLPPDRYVQAHAFNSDRYDPFMPACLLGTVLGDVVACGLTASAVSVLPALGALLALTTVSISVTKNVPVNRWIRTLDPAALPAEWSRLDPRRRWGYWNRLRTTTAVAAFLVNVAAVLVIR
jgi:uncharacterized membrane protein